MNQDSGQLVHPIERIDRKSRVTNAPTPRSREARLHYTVLDRSDDKSLLQVCPETGRRHQIRIQLATFGHPLLGDLRYGARRPLSRRQIALLAHVLKISHPTRNESMVFTSPVPENWPWPLSAVENPPRHRPPWDWKAFRGIRAMEIPA